MNTMIGPYGVSALHNAASFQDISANTSWFHGFDGWAFEECARHGIQACVEFPTFRADYKKHPHLIPIDSDGNPIRYGTHLQGICLSNTDFLGEIENNLKTGLAAYSPAGIWLDYMTYAGWFEDPTPDLQDSCFCPGCIKQFNKAANIDEANPKAIIAHHHEAWVAHKCQRIADFTAQYTSIIRDMCPSAVIGIYMCPYTPEDYNGALRSIFAQDYKLLAPLVDVFTPLIYCKKSGQNANWGREFLEKSPSFVPEGKPVQLILDYMDFPDCFEQAVLSAVPSYGVQMFSGAEVFKSKEHMEIFARCAEVLMK
ncbi:MAG: hypothetical protein FWD03_00825 [Defluviitaleaceae bacterium]|nr:hypothetical protein [Defluviitaleaceae bacterium]